MQSTLPTFFGQESADCLPFKFAVSVSSAYVTMVTFVTFVINLLQIWNSDRWRRFCHQDFPDDFYEFTKSRQKIIILSADLTNFLRSLSSKTQALSLSRELRLG